mgnify:CR=1 FL=1
MSLLEVDHISAGYGNAHVLFDVSLKVEPKIITAIVGPNGSGKSTLLKTILGMTKVYSGSIVFQGKNIASMRPHKVAKLGIAYLPQVENIFTELSVKENLLMACFMLDRSEAETRVNGVLKFFPILKDYIDHKARTLSGGERQMLSLAMVLIREPSLVMLDEPTGNLAPKLATQVFDKIRQLRDEFGLTILMVEQSARKALEMSDQACLMVNGSVAFYGPSKELLAHPELGQLYLGIKS